MKTAVSWIRAALLSLLCGIGTGAEAQELEISGSITFNAFKVEGLVVGKRHVVDQEFAQANNIAVPVGYSFISPRNKKQLVFIKNAPGGTASMKLFFADLEEQVRSHLQFIPFTVDMAEPEIRVKWLKPLIINIFRQQAKDGEQPLLNELRMTRIGKYPALELIGNCQTQADGTIVMRVVAIPHPAGRDGVMMVIGGVANRLGMKKVEDIYLTSASRAVGTFRFLE